MINRIVAGSVSFLARAFPEATGEALPEILKRVPREKYLDDVLKQFGINGLVVQGAQGIFEGSASDVSVIHRYAIDRTWSPMILARIIKFFETKTTGTYIDIGANIGLTAIPVALSGIKTMAFEPVPKNFSALQLNAIRNSALGNLELFNLALLDRAGSVTFELSPTNHGDHRLRKRTELAAMGEDDWDVITVKAEALDRWAATVADPTVVKIDTQGSEPLVLAGGREILDKADVVICEFSPYAMSRMNTRFSDLADFFEQFPKIEIHYCEDENPIHIFCGPDVKSFLVDFYHNNHEKPYGHYLNLVADKADCF